VEFVADLESLTDFFGVEPKLAYPKKEYRANCVTFEVELGNSRVWFQFMPSQGWSELNLGGTPFRVTKLLFSNMTHLAVRKTKEAHYLLIKFSDPHTNDFTLQLRPHIFAFWGNQGSHDEDA
jgi:hypothetical protein